MKIAIDNDGMQIDEATQFQRSGLSTAKDWLPGLCSGRQVARLAVGRGNSLNIIWICWRHLLYSVLQLYNYEQFLQVYQGRLVLVQFRVFACFSNLWLVCLFCGFDIFPPVYFELSVAVEVIAWKDSPLKWPIMCRGGRNTTRSLTDSY